MQLRRQLAQAQAKAHTATIEAATAQQQLDAERLAAAGERRQQEMEQDATRDAAVRQCAAAVAAQRRAEAEQEATQEAAARQCAAAEAAQQQAEAAQQRAEADARDAHAELAAGRAEVRPAGKGLQSLYTNARGACVILLGQCSFWRPLHLSNEYQLPFGGSCLRARLPWQAALGCMCWVVVI